MRKAFCPQACAVLAIQLQFPVQCPSSMPSGAADGWTAGGWSSWTGGNGWEDRRIDSDAMNKRTELGAGKRS